MANTLPRKALISISSFNGAIYQNGQKTGLFFTEALHPIEVLTQAGFEVDIASETGTYGLDEIPLTAPFLELLRIKGEVLCADTTISGVNDAETCFQKSIEWSRRKGVRFFELRAAASLTRLWQMHHRRGEGGKRLSETYGRLTESFSTTELRCMQQVLSQSPAVLA